MAAERCERIGDTVGYSIRLETKRSSRTRLLAMTTGVLLRRLQCDPLLDTVHIPFVLSFYLLSFLVSFFIFKIIIIITLQLSI